jgi:hypothetical protein
MSGIGIVSPLAQLLGLGDSKPQNITININESGQSGGTGHHGKGFLDAAANALGIPEKDLADQLKQGKTMDQVAEDLAKQRGIDPAVLQAKLHAELAQTLQKVNPGLSAADAATQAADIATKSRKFSAMNLDPSKFHHGGRKHHFSNDITADASPPVSPTSQSGSLNLPLSFAA